MMSNPNDPKQLSLRVMINKQKSKVLFAEANSDFVDALLSFLTLPLGKVVTILQKHYGEEAAAIGSLNTLYTGLFNLDESYFCVAGAKKMLLNPQTSFRAECRQLMFDITESRSNQFFLCQDQNCSRQQRSNISLYSDIATCQCGTSLNRKIVVGECLEGGAFTANPSSFFITDDLCVEPMTGIIQMLNNLEIRDTKGAEMKIVSFGINEIRDMLKLALTSATPLTDMIIKKIGMSSNAAKPEPEILLSDHSQIYGSRSGKIVLKVCLQKSTNKLLFAVATDEFVELLFSFLTIPLGGVEFLLGGKTGLNNIDNLYRSVSNDIDDKFFTTRSMRSRLIEPELPHGYISKNRFLPLREEKFPKLYQQWKRNNLTNQDEWCFHGKDGKLLTWFKLNSELYVKKQTMCIVTDDLTVSPSLATSISILRGLGILLSDVKEMELHIGLEEALRILKASLTSKTALTDALIKPMLKQERQLKQEA